MELNETQTKLLVEHILELGERGFPPWLAGIEDFANSLLLEENKGPVDPEFARYFVSLRPELPVKFNDKSNSSPPEARREVHAGWFAVLQKVRARYDIRNEDIYNFEEYHFRTGSMLHGVITSGSVSRRYRDTKTSELHITVLQGLNSMGGVLPPFLLSPDCYRPFPIGDEETHTWATKTTENGRTTEAAALAWLEHFDLYTRPHTVGIYRLLVLDGHESHNSLRFQKKCQEKNIVTVCMPHYCFRTLHPFELGYMRAMKRAFRNTVDALEEERGMLKREDFLPTFVQVFKTAVEEKDIREYFEATGIVPHNPRIYTLNNRFYSRARRNEEQLRTGQAHQAVVAKQEPRNSMDVEPPEIESRDQLHTIPDEKSRRLKKADSARKKIMEEIRELEKDHRRTMKRMARAKRALELYEAESDSP